MELAAMAQCGSDLYVTTCWLLQGQSATLRLAGCHADKHLRPNSWPLPRLAAGAVLVGPGPVPGTPRAPLSELLLEGQS